MCPMVRGRMICLGSCIDHQAVARADDFHGHFDRELFEQLSRATQRSVRDLRATCLRHQLEVVDERILNHSADEAALKWLRVAVENQLQKGS